MERCGAKVTIITAVYNGAAYIKRAIDSIAEQTYDNIEYIVVDGGSTDGTVDILRQHSNVVTRFISEPDKGIYDAMNKGVKMATGDWIYFLGCDDYLYPDFSKMCTLLDDKHTIYYGNVFHRGRVQDGAFTAYKLSKYPIPHQAILYPRVVFEKYSYDLRYKISADHYLTWPDIPKADFLHREMFCFSWKNRRLYAKISVFGSICDIDIASINIGIKCNGMTKR